MSKPARWTAANIPDLSGKTAIITGANSGIGYFTALELARKGATVVLACRSLPRAEAAAQKIRDEVPGASVLPRHLDLASQASVHKFAQDYLASGQPLDLLINNAGVMALPKRTETVDGFEMQFGTNVLGHFALSGLLLPALISTAHSAASPPRIVTLSSIKHKMGKIYLDDLQLTRSYTPGKAYGQSKLADLMFAFELDRRLRGKNIPVLSVAAHPGIAETNLFIRDAAPWQRPMRVAVGKIISLILNTPERGALPTLYAATGPATVSGGYYGPLGLFDARGYPGPARIAGRAQNVAIAAALWQQCEALTGVRFP
jgi:NAD(P)-dependent dehydrogenase (short-subunit alcohol dehydrogenase family)